MAKESNFLTLGEKIRNKRKELGLSLKAFSGMCEVSPSYLGYIENNKTIPSMAKLKQIADCLEISLSYLITENVLSDDDSNIQVSVTDKSGNKYEMILNKLVFPNGLTYEQMCDKIKILEKMEAILKDN